MLDQSFSTENLRRIFDFENRKGNYLEGRFFPHVEIITQRIKEKKRDLRKLNAERKKHASDVFQAKRAVLYDKLNSLKKNKEKQLGRDLEDLSADLAKGRFHLKLKSLTGPDGKQTYSLADTAHAFFVLKQIQINLRSLYLVKQSSRFDILCQLKSLLSDDFPKRIIRTDIEAFYESMPNKPLLEKLESDSLLSVSTRSAIRQILNQYRSLSGKSVGVPRGVGISAYLAELFIRDFDRKVTAPKNIRYFARYVDDIVVIQDLDSTVDKSDSLQILQDSAKEIGLNLNSHKTIAIDFPAESGASFEYLGYKIFTDSDEARFQFTPKKLSRYERRIDAAFDEYERSSKLDEKKARRILVKRILFLTGNTRLRNNKNALIGIYFSNRLLTDKSCLNDLDKHLDYRASKLKSAALKARVNKLSFRDGFEQRRFSHFSTELLGRIAQAWRHVT